MSDSKLTSEQRQREQHKRALEIFFRAGNECLEHLLLLNKLETNSQTYFKYKKREARKNEGSVGAVRRNSDKK
ncbi:7859_t:CDS:2 [Funneliformis caledonium]|uniref:7859_t:CDS:1 n=1 Tax=Funneliformis caledonium TaxID=1117310 RepID=A0A9N9BGC4_9GLOM|nr:7859_t:CDS:2 [Funneliformis caledonium]